MLKTLALISMIWGSSAFAGTVVPAMKCDQAVRYYETHKRIYVLANGHDVVPVYGMKPVSKWRELTCSGRGVNLAYYWVKTTDDDACMIAVFCR